MDLPPKQGLYDPRNEHDACGVGFVVNIKGHKTHDLIRQGLQILINLDHRGAVGADPLMGDGAGCLIQTPDRLLRLDVSWRLHGAVELGTSDRMQELALRGDHYNAVLLRLGLEIGR